MSVCKNVLRLFFEIAKLCCITMQNSAQRLWFVTRFWRYTNLSVCIDQREPIQCKWAVSIQPFRQNTRLWQINKQTVTAWLPASQCAGNKLVTIIITNVFLTLALISECDGSMRNASAASWSQVRAVVVYSSNSASLSRNTGISRPWTMRSSTSNRLGRVDSCYIPVHISTALLILK